VYDYLVIGKGLFGSAATRYLTQVSANVAVLGPDEPADWNQYDGVFASHYDQGRIVSAAGPDEIWNWLDRLSIGQYRPLEAASGVSFYNPIGLLRVCHRDATLQYPSLKRKSYRYQGDEEIELMTADTVRQTYNLQFPEGYDIFIEGAPSGYINPRDMIRAQLVVAAEAGAEIVRETAVSGQNHNTHVQIITKEGGRYRAKKVLLATGAYTNCFELLERKLALRVKSETIILGRVADAEGERFKQMPAVTYEVDSPVLDGIYLLPPIRYPDGRFYIKMGCNTADDQTLHGFEEMQHWCVSGNSEGMKQPMQEAVMAIMPDLQVEHWETKRCLVTYTPHGKPFIDVVEPGRIYMATAGNGTGAHPSDAIGRLAAQLMVTDEWTAELDQRLLQLQWAEA
jgi:sarcosine oxidase